MSVIMIAFELSGQGASYSKINDYIQDTFEICNSANSWCIVWTERSTDEIFEQIRALMGEEDILLVGSLKGTWHTMNVKEQPTQVRD